MKVCGWKGQGTEVPRGRGHLRGALAACLLVAVAATAAACAPPARRPTPSAPSSGGGGVEPGKEIEGIVRTRDRSKKPVHAFVLGNVAVVGVGAATATPAPGPATPGLPPAAAPDRTRTTAPSAAPPTAPATPPTGTTPSATTPTPAGTPPRPGATTGIAPAPAGTTVYTPRPGSVNILDRATVAAIRRKMPFIARVLSTNDAVLVGRIAAVVRDIRARRPVDGRLAEITDIIRALSGPVPAPGAGAPPTGTPAPAPVTPAAPPAGTPPAAPR